MKKKRYMQNINTAHYEAKDIKRQETKTKLERIKLLEGLVLWKCRPYAM